MLNYKREAERELEQAENQQLEAARVFIFKGLVYALLAIAQAIESK